MKKILLALTVFLIWNLIIYIGLSICKWNFNPGQWEEGFRMTGVYIGFSFGLIISIGTVSLTSIK